MRSRRLSTIIGSLVNSSNRYCHSQVSWPNVPLVTKNIPLEKKPHSNGLDLGHTECRYSGVLCFTSQTLASWWSSGSQSHWPWHERSICTWQNVHSQFSEGREVGEYLHKQQEWKPKWMLRCLVAISINKHFTLHSDETGRCCGLWGKMWWNKHDGRETSRCEHFIENKRTGNSGSEWQNDKSNRKASWCEDFSTMNENSNNERMSLFCGEKMIKERIRSNTGVIKSKKIKPDTHKIKKTH